MQPVPGGSFARCEHNSHCDQKKASQATRKKKDLENDVMKYFPKLQPAAARSFMLDNDFVRTGGDAFAKGWSFYHGLLP